MYTHTHVNNNVLKNIFFFLKTANTFLTRNQNAASCLEHFLFVCIAASETKFLLKP